MRFGCNSFRSSSCKLVSWSAQFDGRRTNCSLRSECLQVGQFFLISSHFWWQSLWNLCTHGLIHTSGFFKLNKLKVFNLKLVFFLESRRSRKSGLANHTRFIHDVRSLDVRITVLLGWIFKNQRLISKISNQNIYNKYTNFHYIKVFHYVYFE